MNYESVLQTRPQRRASCESLELQERRIVRACIALVVMAMLLLIFVPEARSQDIYTKNNLPVIGLRYVKQWAKSAVVDPQPGGLNQTWNFSTLSPQKGRLDTIQVLDAKKVIGEVPPLANVVIVNSTNNARDYFNTLKPSLKNLGMEDNSQKALLGSSPYDIDPIPVKLNRSINTVYDGSAQILSQPDITINRSGTTTFMPDGNGTIQLPGSLTRPNVIRVRWTDDRIDTVLRNDQPIYWSRTQITRYVWYAANSAAEYLVITHGDVKFTRITEDPPKDSVINEAQYLVDDFGASPVEWQNDDECRIIPNPTSDELRIQGSCKRDQVIRLHLCSVIGKELISEQYLCSGGSYDLRLHVGDLTQSVYILQLEVDGAIINRIVRVLH